MNQCLFAARNIFDKLSKIIRSPETLNFYLETYVFSRLERVEPEVFVVSYPKCGRTWLRLILQKYLFFLGITEQPFRDKALLSLPDERIIKFEHDQGNWVPAPPSLDRLAFNVVKYAGQKVVFLVRDPRDVVVSSWYHLRYRERIYRKDLSAFIRDDLVGVRKVVAFMNMWVENRDIPSEFLLLTYENLQEDTLTRVHHLLTFAGVSIDDKALERAVAESSFDRMKRMEKTGNLKEPWMRLGARNVDDSMKIRKGKVGGFREELSREDIAYLNEVLRTSLSSDLPYPCDKAWPTV